MRQATESGTAAIAAHRLADAVETLAGATLANRTALARALSGPELEVTWSDAPTVPSGRWTPPNLAHVSRLGEVARELRAIPGELDTEHGTLRSALVSAQLADGTWVNAKILAVSLLEADDTAFRVAIAAIACALLLGAAVASRVVASPLARLARAVRDLPLDGVGTLPPVGGPREVREVAEALDTATRRTRELLRQRSLALGALSHDLMSPIARLKLRVHEMPEAELRRRLLGDLAEMEGMVGDVLAYMRGGDGGGEPAVPVSVPALVQVVVDEFAEAGATIEERRLDEATVLARPVTLKRAVRNLVENALKHGRDPWVEVRASGTEVQVRVGDRGPGLSPEDLARAFEPFFRGDRARAGGGGSGLGLPTARTIAEAHSGLLELTSALGQGTEAVLRLPRTGPEPG
jgi:signal transduction histidine kinase